MRQQMWIKATLKAKGCKLKDMAEALNITAPRVTDILRGTREVQSDELADLAALLGLNLRSLLASLEAGQLTKLADKGGYIDVAGHLMGDGSLIPLAGGNHPSQVALPPDAETSEGLFCYIMGDNSMAQEIKAGDIIIAADPRKHFYPMVPGVLLLVRCGGDKIALRQFVKSDSGESWLVPLPDQPDPKLASWRFGILPSSLSDITENVDEPATTASPDVDTTSSDKDREIPTGETLHTGHIAAAVLWVHRRYRPQESG